MTNLTATLPKRAFLQTLRTDKWWVEPLLVLFGLTAFAVYATWAAFQGDHYWVGAPESTKFGGYLSPFYSPPLFIDTSVPGSPPAWHGLGGFPGWWPQWLPTSPALLILVFPLLFRFTCYYYRGAYYKAFAGSPPGCAVDAIPQKDYRGETFLLVFQNLHRYALYFALLFMLVLSADGIAAFFRDGEFGMGVGSWILIINPTLLGFYTLGCHSWRHLIGGRKDCFSCAGMGQLRYGAYQKVSWLNQRHKLFAWCSLFWVGFSDFYVRMVSKGVWVDWSTWGN